MSRVTLIHQTQPYIVVYNIPDIKYNYHWLMPKKSLDCEAEFFQVMAPSFDSIEFIIMLREDRRISGNIRTMFI